MRAAGLGLILLLTGLLVGHGCQTAPRPVRWGVALEGRPITDGRLTDLSARTGLKPRLVVFFQMWPASPDGPVDFPLASLKAIDGRGATPVITWEPMFLVESEERAVSGTELLAGQWDAYLSAFAQAAKDWGRPLVIRFGHEMNLRRYHWGGPEAAYGPASPELFQKMHRHVVGLFRQVGADRVKFAFCPNAESIPNTSFDKTAGWNTLAAYYPGDEWVDLLGLDGYNWGTTQTRERNGWQSRWQSFEQIFGPAREELRRIADRAKPLIVFETASADRGGDKAAWIKDAAETAGRWGLAGLVWFQADKEVDWRIGSGVGPSPLAGLAIEDTPLLP